MERHVLGTSTGRLTLMSAAVAMALLAGCREKAGSPLGPEPDEDEHDSPVPGLVVSEPRSVPGGAASLAGAATGDVPMAYVSAAPGTLADAVQVRIRNETAAAAALPPVTVVAGGFDPVGVVANPDDRLELAILQYGGAIAYAYLSVPKRRPPVVVRTNPPKGRTDVAISVRPRVVFSEPIDPGSLDGSSIRLTRDGTAVNGVLAIAADQPFVAEFTPATPLEPLTGYQLVVSTTVRDLDGEALAESLVVDFVTESNQGPPAVEATDPQDGDQDVPVSIQPAVVFTKPIDPQSLSPASFRLLRDGSPVAGEAAVHPTNPFVATFTPVAPLEPLTGYELVVSTAIRALDGESLQEELRVRFHTEWTGTGGATVRVSNVTTGGAFDVDGYRVRVTAGGQLLRTGALELNASIDLGPLPPGAATIELEDVAANCSVIEGTSRNVDLSASVIVPLEFRTTCTPPADLGSVRLILSKWDRFSTAGEVFHLWSTNADGTDSRQLTTGTVSDLGAIVSPDGARVAFSRNTQGHGVWGRFSTWSMDPDGNQVTQLTDIHKIAWSWSPDGTRIAVQGNGIEVVRADGTGHQDIFPYPRDGFPSSPTWSPDGSTIAFFRFFRPEGEEGFECGNPALRHEIWAMDADGGSPRFLRRLLTCWGGSHLSWTSNGEILFTDASDGQAPALWRMGPDGTGAVRLLEVPSGMDLGTWSSDGKLVTLTRTYSAPDWRVDLYLLNVATGELVRVTADGVSMGAAFLR